MIKIKKNSNFKRDTNKNFPSLNYPKIRNEHFNSPFMKVNFSNSSFSTFSSLGSISFYSKNSALQKEGEGTRKHKKKIASNIIVSKVNNQKQRDKAKGSESKKDKVDTVYLEKKYKTKFTLSKKPCREKRNKDHTQNYVFDLTDEFLDTEYPSTPKASKIPSFKVLKSMSISNINLIKLLLIENITDCVCIFLTVNDIINFSLINKRLFQTIYSQFLKRISKEKFWTKDKKEKVWLKIYQNSPLSKYPQKNVEKTFFHCLYSTEPLSKEITTKISLDIERTFPNEESFKKGGENYNKLFQILKAYSLYNKKLNYVQGMNFITGIILSEYKDQIKSFIFLDGLVKFMSLDNIMSDNPYYLSQKVKELSKVIKNIWTVEYLLLNKIEHESFTLGWLLTLFSNSMKKDIIYPLWDFIFIFKWKFIYCFISSIFSFFEEKVSILPIKSLCDSIRNFFKSNQFEKEFWSIIEKSFEVYKLYL